MGTGWYFGIGFLVVFLIGLFLFRKYWNKPSNTNVHGGDGAGNVDAGKNDNDNQTT